MEKFYIHIGTHKTGTTSIQMFMDSNGAALSQFGALYPKAARPHQARHGQHLLARQLSHPHQHAHAIWEVDGEAQHASWLELLEEVSRSDAGKFVVSSENFTHMNEGDIKRIRRYLDDFDVKIVVYLRNPFDYVVSCYRQHVKQFVGGRDIHRYTWWSGTFREYLEDRVSLCDYPGLLGRWAAVFSKENVIVRPFDKVKGHPRLCLDFLEVIGVNPESFAGEFPPTTNESPPDRVISALRMLNRFERSRIGRRVPARFRDRARHSIMRGGRLGRFATGFAERIMEEKVFTKENIEFLRKRATPWMETLTAEWLEPGDEVYFVIADRADARPSRGASAGVSAPGG